MTILIVSLNNDDGGTENMFCHGTGFASLPSSSIIMALFNVTQVPTILVVDTDTGRLLPSDAGLAMEWNDPHYVLNAWQRGSSGLTVGQKVLAVMSFQSDCVIL
jgi:hypothetical protein